MSKQIELLKGIFGEQVSELSEDQVAAISAKLEKLIETRVSTKVKFQTEVIEAEAKEKYDTLLKESTQQYEKNLKAVETKTCELAESFKKKMEDKAKKFVTECTKKSEGDMKVFKESLVEKLDKYLDLELEKKIPDTYVEAVAQVSVLQPIVEGFKKVMEENYIKFDEENFGLLKDARTEIIAIREELAKTTKENMEMNGQLKDAKRSVKISKVCEGLTDAQRERASKLLEAYDVDEIEDRYNSIRDIIIENTETSTDEEEGKDAQEENEEVDPNAEMDQNDEEEKESAPKVSGAVPVKGQAVKGKKAPLPAGTSTGSEKGKNVPADKAIKTTCNEKADVEEAPINEENEQIRTWAKTFRSEVSSLLKK